MAATDFSAHGSVSLPSRPGLFQAIFATMAFHPSPPLVEASEEAVLSQPVVPRQLRLSIAWWRSWRLGRQADRNLRRLEETSPHLLRDVGIADPYSVRDHEQHLYGLAGRNY